MRRRSIEEIERRRTDDVTLTLMHLVKCCQLLQADALRLETGLGGLGLGERLDSDLALRVERRVARLFRIGLQVGPKLELFSRGDITRVLGIAVAALAEFDDGLEGRGSNDVQESA